SAFRWGFRCRKYVPCDALGSGKPLGTEETTLLRREAGGLFSRRPPAGKREIDFFAAFWKCRDSELAEPRGQRGNGRSFLRPRIAKRDGAVEDRTGARDVISPVGDEIPQSLKLAAPLRLHAGERRFDPGVHSPERVGVDHRS